MWAKHDTTARTRTPAITTMCGQITKTHCAIDAAVRRSIAARVRAIDAPVVNDESSIDWAQNPAPEQHESPGNVATQCHFVPRIKHVAEARKPNSPLHLRKKTAPDQGPGQHAPKKAPRVQSNVQCAKEADLRRAARVYRHAVDSAVGRLAQRADLVHPSDCRACQERRAGAGPRDCDASQFEIFESRFFPRSSRQRRF